MDLDRAQQRAEEALLHAKQQADGAWDPVSGTWAPSGAAVHVPASVSGLANDVIELTKQVRALEAALAAQGGELPPEQTGPSREEELTVELEDLREQLEATNEGLARASGEVVEAWRQYHEERAKRERLGVRVDTLHAYADELEGVLGPLLEAGEAEVAEKKTTPEAQRGGAEFWAKQRIGASTPGVDRRILLARAVIAAREIFKSLEKGAT